MSSNSPNSALPLVPEITDAKAERTGESANAEAPLFQALDAIKAPDVTANIEEQSTAADSPRWVQYDERIVAFVDILGFKEIIYKSANDPALVTRIFDALDVGKDDWATMFAADVGLMLKPDDFDDRFHSFSDCIVISVPKTIQEIGLLIYVTFKICRQLLGQGFTSRGGIAMGKLFHRDNDESKKDRSLASAMVFGPAFVDAYQFESSHADGPRVILQNQVWRFIESERSKSPSTKLSKFLEAHVQRAEDGPAFVDLFADFGHNSFYETRRDLETEIEAIQKHICDALDASSDKPQIFRKNAELAREFNRAVRKAELHKFTIPGSKLPKRHRDEH